MIIFLVIIILALIILAICLVLYVLYKNLSKKVLEKLGYKKFEFIAKYDDTIIVKSRQTLEKYDVIKYLKDDSNRLGMAEIKLVNKKEQATKVKNFISSNQYKNKLFYYNIEKKLKDEINNAENYRVFVDYITRAGNHLDNKTLIISLEDIKEYKEKPYLLMSKSNYNQYLKQQEKEKLENKQKCFIDRINNIIDLANAKKDYLIIKGSKKELDDKIYELYDKVVKYIFKVKKLDSEEWTSLDKIISGIESDVNKIIDDNDKILKYYDSYDFKRIKETCSSLMNSQKDFNEYIDVKVKSLVKLFGTKVIRNETINKDEYNYIRPYKKDITPFTAEVSAAVFGSAENNPLEYIIKYFYPNKSSYKEQISNLYLLIEELETLKDAKKIIENYKLEYKQYLNNVPKFVLDNDEAGFYSRLGFAHIEDSDLEIEYKFSYTSDGGFAKREFTFPMTEDNIVELIKTLENKMTNTYFVKEQRVLMTHKLREQIKKRDHYTCCICGNSIQKEPNLLLEIDHIIPVSKGGKTTEDNLQTLCWKCNRSKSNKLIV